MSLVQALDGLVDESEEEIGLVARIAHEKVPVFLFYAVLPQIADLRLDFTTWIELRAVCAPNRAQNRCLLDAEGW